MYYFGNKQFQVSYLYLIVKFIIIYFYWQDVESLFFAMLGSYLTLWKVKAAEHSADHTIPSYAEVTETGELYFTCPIDRNVGKGTLLC